MKSLLKSDSRAINSPCKVRNSMFFNVSSGLCSDHHSLVLEHFTTPPKPIPTNSSFSCSSKPLVTVNLLSVCMDLKIIGISYNQNHIICSLSWTGFLHLHNVFKAYQCCNMHQSVTHSHIAWVCHFVFIQ